MRPQLLTGPSPCPAVPTHAPQIYVHAANHAGYYPGAAPISLKLLFSPTDGRVLGCQATGTVEGVEKRVDVIATIMQASAPGGKQYVLGRLCSVGR